MENNKFVQGETIWEARLRKEKEREFRGQLGGKRKTRGEEERRIRREEAMRLKPAMLEKRTRMQMELECRKLHRWEKTSG